MSRWSREWRTDWRVSTSMAPGPTRVETTEHDPSFVARPVGFAPPSDVPSEPVSELEVGPDSASEVEPDLWDGDQA